MTVLHSQRRIGQDSSNSTRTGPLSHRMQLLNRKLAPEREQASAWVWAAMLDDWGKSQETTATAHSSIGGWDSETRP